MTPTTMFYHSIYILICYTLLRTILNSTFDEVIKVESLDSKDSVNLALLDRPELGVTFTKLNCWKLTQYQKCVFMDADTLVIRNSDDLFNREELSASPDAGWPDCFNSGVFVYVPSLATFSSLMEFAKMNGSFDGGDQGLLNDFFDSWATSDISKRLPFTYNMCATATYSYLPAYKKFSSNVRIVHFIGASKPWHAMINEEGTPVLRSEDRHASEHLLKWWDVYNRTVKKSILKDQTVSYALSLSCPSLKEDCPSSSLGVEGSTSSSGHNISSAYYMPQDNRESWEAGHPDYMGTASFDKILHKITSNIEVKTPDTDSSKSENSMKENK